MQVTLTHINGNPIRKKWQLRAISRVREFEECVNECCRLTDEERWFSTDRVDRLQRYARQSVYSRQGWYNDVGLNEWLDIVRAKMQELDAKIALLELSGQL